jgi:glutaredoxin-like protein NrdH
MATIKVAGKDMGDVFIYALSTCGWCKKMKSFLSELGVEYCYVDVDQTAGEERESVISELRGWNDRLSFPTVVIGKEKCIVGFKEEEMKKALGL